MVVVAEEVEASMVEEEDILVATPEDIEGDTLVFK